MKLSIENFAKIKEADIIIDGITVIAGENNTGKSTVGKILFSLFNSLNDIDNKIIDDRLSTLEKRILLSCLRRTDMSTGSSGDLLALDDFSKNISRELKRILQSEYDVKSDLIKSMLNEQAKMLVMKLKSLKIDMREILPAINENITTVLDLPEETIIKEIISTYFGIVFSSQINARSKDCGEKAVLNLTIKDEDQKLTFENDTCVECKQDVKITHKAIYIDNPHIVDYLGEEQADLNVMEKLLVDLLKEDSADVFDGVVEKVLVKEKLQDIYKMLQSVVDGEIIVEQNDVFSLKSEQFNNPIMLQNLSMGLKSFVILKMLLEKGALKEKDVVILDEPEIHLHPQWQVAYAELIVLLQKVFDLSIVVTTHSPYFVDALDLFSHKHGTDKKVNYYLASNIDNMVQMECVTDHIEAIYKKMVSPVQALDALRYELNNN